MEVDQRLLSNLSSNITLGLYLLHLLFGSIVGVDVGVVVLGVVELHDRARDGRLEGAIVVCIHMYSCVSHCTCTPSIRVEDIIAGHVHGRSGSVALLRVKVVLARAARFVADEAAVRRAVRRALLLRSVLDMVND